MLTPDTEESESQALPVVDEGAATAWLSWLRVLAICAVVTIHTVGTNATRPDARETLRGQLAILMDVGAIFAVPVFVMVSGAMMLDPRRFRGNRAFLRKRAARLVPALVFWHLWYAGLVVFVKDRDLSAEDLLGRALSGQLYTALYFFWIVAGLALVTPVLIPFVRDNTRRTVLVAGVVASAVPALTMATVGLRDSPVAFADSAFTWWFPYLGVFLLGYGLREVVLRGLALWSTVAAAAALGSLLAWQWRNAAVPDWLQTASPVTYYGAGCLLYTVLVYLAARGLLDPRGPLRFATRPRAARWGRVLGDATLGVFAVHLTVLYVVRKSGIGGPDNWSPTGADMLLRLAVVLVATWAIVLVLRRIPYVRALL